MLDIENTSPMLCGKINKEKLDTLGSEWIAEQKFDGSRVLFFISEKINMINRRKEEKLFQYPEFKGIKEWLNCDECVLDGELIVNNDFSLLASRDHLLNEFKIKLMSKEYPATFLVFDILWLDGKNLTKTPLRDRKEILKGVVKKNERIKIVKIFNNPRELFEEVMTSGGEGIILKKMDSLYVFKRSDDWLKLKREQILIVPVLGWNEKNGDSYGSIQTPIGDVGLLSFKNKDLLDILVREYGYGNFDVKVKFLEISKKSGHARFPIFLKFITRD